LNASNIKPGAQQIADIKNELPRCFPHSDAYSKPVVIEELICKLQYTLLN